jgi:hypothetical protein
MCKCTPEIRTPFCEKNAGCQWPKPEGVRAEDAPQTDAPVTTIEEPQDKDFQAGANKMLAKTAQFKSK